MHKEADTERVYEDAATLPLSRAYSDNYFKFPALASLIEQIMILHELKPQSVLEIGKGNGFVSEFFRRSGMDITTFDINPAFEPDVVGDVVELDKHFEEGSFDWILCAEVLEHIPFEDAQAAWEKMSKICRGGAVITIPTCELLLFHFTGIIRMAPQRVIPLKAFGCLLAVPRSKPADCHHWEIGSSRQTRKGAIKKLLRNHFSIRKSWRSAYCPNHRFFVLEKKS